jgi:uncharacterized protein with HEPN domain
MQRDYKVYIEDIIKAIENIEEYTRGISFEKFLQSRMLQDAVIRNFEIIGEAVKNIPQEEKGKHKQIDWRGVAGLRDVLIHRYFGVNLSLLWDIIKNKLPDLKNKISTILEKGK